MYALPSWSRFKLNFTVVDEESLVVYAVWEVLPSLLVMDALNIFELLLTVKEIGLEMVLPSLKFATNSKLVCSSILYAGKVVGKVVELDPTLLYAEPFRLTIHW